MTWTATTTATAIATIARASETPLRPADTLPRPDLTTAQTRAVQRARAALASFGGALIAEPAGTGKSFIGLEIALDAARQQRAVLITAPAALHTTWSELARAHQLRFHWLSHTRLSRDDASVAATPRPDFILVDESHAFRNPDTRRYHTLARLARRAKVLMLSATPINNSLLDLYFQLRIFLADSSLAHLGITDLRAAFHAATTTGHLHDQLASAIHHLVIRSPVSHASPRPASRSTSGPVTSPPATRPLLLPPTVISYDLDTRAPGFTRAAINTLADLSLAAFSPLTPRQPAELLRLTLAKRMESGLAAFASSIRSLIAFHMAFLDALDAGIALRPRDLVRTADRAVQLAFAAVVGIPLPRAAERPRLRRLVEDDLARLQALLQTVRHMLPHDPKRDALQRLLDGPLHGRRTLIFTEFRDTAADLWSRLRTRPAIGRLDGSGASIASGRCTRSHLLRTFAPHANNAAPPPLHEDIRCLIATDILSEGINLQDADTVVSYDLPWNPVRLIQRIGRIHRMGSVHASVQAFIFMPDHWLDAFMTLLDRVRSKLDTIGRSLASTAPPDLPVAADRHVAFVHALTLGMDPDTAVARAQVIARQEPASTRSLFDHPRVRAEPAPDPGITPVAVVPAATTRPFVLLAQITPAVRFASVRGSRAELVPIDRAVRLLLSALAHPDPPAAAGLSPQAVLTLDRAVARAAGIDHTPTPACDGAAARAVRRILRIASGHGPRTIRLADRLVHRISAGLRAGDLHALRQWNTLPLPPGDAAAAVRLLRALERQLRAAAPAPPTPRTIAAFLVHPASPHDKGGAPEWDAPL